MLCWATSGGRMKSCDDCRMIRIAQKNRHLPRPAVCFDKYFISNDGTELQLEDNAEQNQDEI